MKKEGVNIGSPVKTFISQTVKEIEDGLPKNYDLTSNIDFELSVVNQQTNNGKIDLRVVGIGGGISTQNIQKVRFSVGDPKKAEQQVKKFVNILKDIAETMDKKKKHILKKATSFKQSEEGEIKLRRRK